MHPRMFDADMVGREIDHQLHFPRVQRIGKMAVIGQASKVESTAYRSVAA